MSLYDDDFDVADKKHSSNLANDSQKQDSNTAKIISSTWNSNSFKLLETQLQAKRHHQQLTSASKRPKPATSASPVIKQAPIETTKQETIKLEIKVSQSRAVDQVAPVLYECEDEYDPMKPNDYDKLVKDSKRQQIYTSNDSNSSSNDSTKYSHSRSSNRSRHDSPPRDKNRTSMKSRHDSDDDYETSTKRSNFSGATFAPPPSLIEEDKKSSVAPIDDLPSTLNKIESPKASTSSVSGLSLAEKMMAKMGYKEGEGLGRNKQGMSQALQVEKIGLRVGRIIHEKDSKVTQESQPVKEHTGISNDLMKNQSKVILLRNMVGPGEVDKELEDETKEECQKYGEVSKVIIFEIPDTTPEESVRIFVEFKTLPGAIKALVDLNGRFFAGRKVKATFYNIDKFRRFELIDEY